MTNKERLAKRLTRRYWVFTGDIAELKYGIGALTWTSTTFDRAEQYVLDSPHTHNYLLDTVTGDYWARLDGQLVSVDLVKILRANQKEFDILQNM